MANRVLVVLAEGFEDMEAVAPIDILTRASVEVTVVSLEEGPVRAAHGIKLIPDTSIDKIGTGSLYDGIVFPGGMGNAERLAAHPQVVELVHNHHKRGKLVAAICASPGLVLAEAAGILRGKRATGHPDFEEKLTAGGATVTDQIVTVDGNIITGMGPGAALPFALQLAEYLVGREIPDDMAKRWRVDRKTIDGD